MRDVDWKRLTVHNLRGELKKRGPDRKGRKTEVVGRLMEATQANDMDVDAD